MLSNFEMEICQIYVLIPHLKYAATSKGMSIAKAFQFELFWNWEPTNQHTKQPSNTPR